MKNIINQVYWEQISNTYMMGTHFKKINNEKIFLENLLMTSGKKIMDWSSNLNYQVFKEVPSLPILRNGKKYKIKISLKVKPQNTLLFCLHFLDLQMSEISNLVFSSLDKTFTYPSEAVSYTFEILNGGCSQIEFSKFQIASADVNDNYFDDFLLRPLSENDSAKKMCLILVGDSKRSREIEQIKVDSVEDTQFYLGNVSWQNRENLSSFLKKWLEDHPYDENFIFTTSQAIDDELKKLKLDSSKYQVINNEVTSSNNMQATWFAPEVIQVDQKVLVKNILQYFKR